LARALIVGCGCRGSTLGRALLVAGWQVRGTTRSPERLRSIEEAGIEAGVADPDRVGTVLDHVGDVTVLAYLMGTAEAEPESIAAIHGPRLERLLERLVDTPVRGFVYEAGGGSQLVSDASSRWQLRTSLIEADPGDHESWLKEAGEAVTGIVAP
jgi:nucleoside-diphosphate-sugar epimerase